MALIHGASRRKPRSIDVRQGDPIMKQLLAALGTTMCLTSLAHGGVILHNVTQRKGASTTESEGVMYVQNGMVRSEQRDAHGHLQSYVLFRDDAIWLVSVRAHSYTKLDRATMQRMTAQMPPQFRAMIEKMRGGDGAASKGESAWRDTGHTERVGDYSCRVWEGAPAGQKEQRCIVPFNALPGGSELSATSQQVGRVIKEVLSNSLLDGASNALAEAAKLNGIAAVTRRESGETYLKSVEQKNLPADIFEVPEGYEQKQTPFGGAHAREE
jgi:hypothetical protein